MKFGEHHFRFRLIPFLMLGLPVPVFLALGIWQVDRAEQKRVQADTLAQRQALPPLQLIGLEPDAQALRYRTVRVAGAFEPEGQFFVENRRYGQRTGFHVITPLRIGGSEVRVLVNRGWVESLPGNRIPAAPVPTGLVQVVGEAQIALPPALSLHAGPEAAKAWGGRWPYVTSELYAATVDHPVQPFLILQDPADPDGFLRQWPREMPKEGMHLGYAIQWFAFAAISLGFYLKLSLVTQEAAA
jgi:surfeit locus 1 family protein